MLSTKFRFICPSDFRVEFFLEIDQSETSIVCGGHVCYRGHSIDASYQVSVHLAKGFKRRRLKCEKLTDDGRQTTDDGCQVMAKSHVAFGKVS